MKVYLNDWVKQKRVERATVNKLRYMSNHYSDWYTSILSVLAHSFWQCFHCTVLLNTVAHSLCTHTHACMHTQTCIYTHILTYMNTHTFTHDTYLHMHTHTHRVIHTCMHTHSHTSMHIHTHTYAYTLTHAYTHSKLHTGTGMPAHTSMPLCALKWTQIELINLKQKGKYCMEKWQRKLTALRRHNT